MNAESRSLGNTGFPATRLILLLPPHSPNFLNTSEGCGSPVVKVSDRGWSCHEFDPRATKDPPCRSAVHVKSVDS
ncbi:hypothetical protein TNCV_2311661 [Trichonephila clavipes]|nr:hypothetical protein TNCV_2311661 [Trichonephila clavipes]